MGQQGQQSGQTGQSGQSGQGGSVGQSSSSNQPGQTGPSAGRAFGSRGPGYEEKVGFEQSRVRPLEIDPEGEAIGALPFEGELPEGEASLPVSGARRDRVEKLAEEVRSEPLPIHRKARLELFHRRVLDRLEEGGD
ncbi:MAG TPA: hypothetical protein VK116_03735 [Planctomycetota bacterium]|nr:hypothetical protein [Planctomycetota bacterium]